MFSCKPKHMQFYKAGYWVVFIKTRTETCIKGWDWTCRLQSLLGCPVLRARDRGTGPRSWARSTARQRALLRSHRDLQRTQTSTHQYTENKGLSLSSNREHMKYRVQSNIFGWTLNGMARTGLRRVWYSFGLIRVYLVHEMMGCLRVSRLNKESGTYL